MKHRLSQFIAMVAVAVTAIFAMSAPAQAAAVRTAWDPLFGPPLSDIGWKGEMLWDDGPIVPGVSNVQALSVSFFTWSTGVGIAVSKPLFLPASLTNFKIDTINKGVDGKTVSYASSMWTDWQRVEPLDNQLQDWFFQLQFQIVGGKTYAQLATKPSNDPNNPNFSAIKYSDNLALAYCDTRTTDPQGFNSTCGLGSQAGSIPTPVPEPGSMALVAAALMGAGLAGRRRSVRSSR